MPWSIFLIKCHLEGVCTWKFIPRWNYLVPTELSLIQWIDYTWNFISGWNQVNKTLKQFIPEWNYTMRQVLIEFCPTWHISKHDFCGVFEHKKRNIKQYCFFVWNNIMFLWNKKLVLRQKADATISWCFENKCSAFELKNFEMHLWGSWIFIKVAWWLPAILLKMNSLINIVQSYFTRFFTTNAMQNSFLQNNYLCRRSLVGCFYTFHFSFFSIESCSRKSCC